MNTPLLEVIRSIKKDIENAQKAKDIWLWIADHADELNNAQLSHIFVVLQEYSLSEFFQYFGRIFDKGNKQVCLSKAVRKMKPAQIYNEIILIEYLENNFPTVDIPTMPNEEKLLEKWKVDLLSAA